MWSDAAEDTCECKYWSSIGLDVAAVSFGGRGMAEESAEVTMSKWSGSHPKLTASANSDGPRDSP